MRIVDLFESEVNDENVFKIPDYNMGYLKERIQKLNKKATKLGVVPVQLELMGRELVVKKSAASNKETAYYLNTIKVIGEPPKIAGWHLVASIDCDISGNIINVVPGQTLPVEYRSANPKQCDQCHTQRDRKNAYVVQHDNGEYKQVGRSCLKDFLGHKDPKLILAVASYISAFLDEIRDAETREEYGQRPENVEELERFLAYTACQIRLHGWTPKSAESETNRATVYGVWSNMYPSPKYADEAERPEERDYKLAQEAIKWAREELANKPNLSDYEYNLVNLTKSDEFASKHAGYVASLIAAYHRSAEQAINYAKRTASAKEIAEKSNFVGKVGDRLSGLNLTVIGVRQIPTQFGTSTIIRMLDENTNAFVWFASGSIDIKAGDVVVAAGRVKNQGVDKYNHDAKTTYLSHVKYTTK
jgi:hypothetical protein